MKKVFKLNFKYLTTLFFIFLSSFLIYYVSHRQHPDWYKHFAYQAEAFLHGRTDLRNLPGYYLDLIHYRGKIYIPNPPLPAIILIPFVSIRGVQTDEVRVSQFLGAITVALVFILLTRMDLGKKEKFFLTALFGFGTVFFSTTILGTTWFFAHLVATLFLVLALIEFFGQKRAFLMGFFIGLAALSRQATVLGSVFFLIMFWGEKNFRKQVLFFALGLALPFSFQAFFNFARFGNFFESGYLLQNWYSSYQAADIAKYGFFNHAYLPRHLSLIFLKMPIFLKQFPFFKPDPEGMAVWLTTPAFFLLVLAPWKEKIVKASLLTSLMIALPALFYTAAGWVQFGYRYALDFLPFLFLPLALAYSKRPTVFKTFLIFLSIFINAAGAYWAVKLGW